MTLVQIIAISIIVGSLAGYLLADKSQKVSKKTKRKAKKK